MTVGSTRISGHASEDGNDKNEPLDPFFRPIGRDDECFSAIR